MAEEIRGVSLLYTTSLATENAAVAAVSIDVGGSSGTGAAASAAEGFGNRMMNMVMQEFNSVAWTEDMGRVLCAGGCAAA